MSWGAYMRDSNLEHLEQIGSALNLHIGCPVHYPAYDKRLFECKCNVIFPVWMVEAAVENGNWEDIDRIHRRLT